MLAEFGLADLFITFQLGLVWYIQQNYPEKKEDEETNILMQNTWCVQT